MALVPCNQLSDLGFWVWVSLHRSWGPGSSSSTAD